MCRYYDKKHKLCSIYNERPVICDVDRYYEENLNGKIDREEYYKTNYVVCKMLKRNIVLDK